MLIGTDGLSCPECVARFPVVDRVADFSSGNCVDRFDSEADLTLEARAGLELEVEGVRSRVEAYYGPRLHRLQPASAGPLRVLDCGCGNGLSVDLLCGQGFDAWGLDLSQLRRWQWRERTRRDRLVVADALAMPFAGGRFDVVLSSGMIEHIGVDEGRRDGSYWVRPRTDRSDLRRRAMAELLRVCAAGGRVWLDVPNGAFPVDFWHTDAGAGMRLHGPNEGFLPTLRELRRLVGDLPGPPRLRALSPAGRLRFRQVGRRWYGRALGPAVRLLLAVMDWPGLRWLAGSPVNPYLVVELRRNPGS